jgi:hypothetical protein
MQRLIVFILLIVPLCLSAGESTGWSPREYRGYKIWLDCDKRAAVKFEYQVGLDREDVKRSALLPEMLLLVMKSIVNFGEHVGTRKVS